MFKAQRNRHGAWLVMHHEGKLAITVGDTRKEAVALATRLSKDEQAVELGEALAKCVLADYLAPGEYVRLWRVAASAIIEAGCGDPSLCEVAAHILRDKACGCNLDLANANSDGDARELTYRRAIQCYEKRCLFVVLA